MTTFGATPAAVNGNSNSSSDNGVVLSTEAFEDYFASTATFSGARRLAGEVSAVRASHDPASWAAMGEQGRGRAVEQALVAPDIAARYQEQQQQQDKRLPLGVTQVYPRLRQRTGAAKRVVVVENGSGAGSAGEDLDSGSSSGCTYTFHDEHSAPFGFRSRSQQDLSFEAGALPEQPPGDGGEEDGGESGLEAVAAAPSKILTRSIDYVRMSRGNPSFAKPVGIPVVPSIPKVTSPARRAPEVPPEQINNFVYESAPDRVVLDFGSMDLENGNNNNENHSQTAEERLSNRAGSPAESSRSSSSSQLHLSGAPALLNKMRRSIAHKSATLTRRTKRKSGPVAGGADLGRSALSLHRKSTSNLMTSSYHEDNRPTISAPTAAATTAATTPSATAAATSKVLVKKPSVAPPPPPPGAAATAAAATAPAPTPVAAVAASAASTTGVPPTAVVAPMKKVEADTRNPPAPPERKSSFSKPVLVQGGLEKAPPPSDLQPSPDAAATKEVQKGPATSNTAPPAHPGKDTGELDDFKIDLTTGEDLPKTGFDFLDNW